MSLTSTREIDSLIGELKVLRAKIVSDGSRVETLAPRVHRTESVGDPTDEMMPDGLTHKELPVLPVSHRTIQNAEHGAYNRVEPFTANGTLDGALRDPAYRPARSVLSDSADHD